MNRNEFLQEVCSSDLCPADFEKVYTEFRKYQKAAMDTLLEFHRVCENNGIDYQLAYGSLLGAIRDGGQIPWDYDIDVIIPYEQNEKLIEALKKDLNKDYYFYCPEVDPKCRHYMMRLAPVGYRTEALHVDVFYNVGMPAETERHSAWTKELFDLFHGRYLKLVNAGEETGGNLRHWVRLMKGKLKLLKMPLTQIEKRFRNMCSQYPLQESKTCGVIGDNKITLPTDLLWDTMLYETENGIFRVTKNYEQILQIMYGDYRRIYPLESRLQEMLGYYQRLIRFEIKK